MMKVVIVKPFGFCAGVFQAIETAKKIKEENPHKNIYIFGMLVHNHEVIDELSLQGITTIDIRGKNPIEELSKFTDKDVVIFTAHGHNTQYDRILDENHVVHFDTVCPQVKKNLTIIDYYQKDSQIIFIGQRNHPEAEAALAISGNVFLYDTKEKMNYSLVTKTTPLVTNQTTLSFIDLEVIIKDIKKHFPEAIFVDEICKATGLRQLAVQQIPQTATSILVVGSLESSNTEKLFRIAKDYHPNARVVRVKSLADFNPNDFDNDKEVYITGGTSTPLNTLNCIKNALESRQA